MIIARLHNLERIERVTSITDRPTLRVEILELAAKLDDIGGLVDRGLQSQDLDDAMNTFYKMRDVLDSVPER